MRTTALAATLIVGLALVANAQVGGLRAEPGLWQMTLRGERNGQTLPVQSHRHCVSPRELADPLSAFAPPPPRQSCRRTRLRTSEIGIYWGFECLGQSAIVTDGSITFDSPEHYTGMIGTRGLVKGQQLLETVSIEGQRVGACAAIR